METIIILSDKASLKRKGLSAKSKTMKMHYRQNSKSGKGNFHSHFIKLHIATSHIKLTPLGSFVCQLCMPYKTKRRMKKRKMKH